MSKIAVVLSGCGVFDGSEIHESILTLLAITKAGASYQCLAPNIEQQQVINHVNKMVMPQERRNVLIESARVARGEILDIAEANVNDYDALVFPGGFGAAVNLSDFASAQEQATVQPDTLRFAKAMAKAGKPLGFLCIAPALIAQIFGPGVTMTIGSDQATAKVLTKMGNIHQECPVDNIIVDKQHRVISTPAYMLGKNIAEIAIGIERLVNQLINLTKQA